MSDSNITKRALSQALKELMKTRPIEKISVGNICDACGLNRKSFYYHFQDKYELIYWIYCTEFLDAALSRHYDDSLELLDSVCCYFYDNREFYVNTFRMEGQNSFSGFFHSVVYAILKEQLSDVFSSEPSIDPYAEFYTDAIVQAIKKWLLRKDRMPPHEFASFIEKALLGVSRHMYARHADRPARQMTPDSSDE